MNKVIPIGKVKKAKKILCLFDYVARTGFSTVSTNIVKEIKKHYGDDIQLDIIAINYFGKPYTQEDGTYVISARLNDVNDDPFGRYFFLKVLNDSNEYDGIFICQDLGVIQPIVEVLQHIKQEKKENNKKVFKSIFYFPIDSKIVPQLIKNLEFFDLLVTYTNYAKEEVLRHRPELKIKVIPHGNNSKDFYPISKEEIASFRKEYFGENSDKFIITNINRNQPRKDLPNTIFGFIEAKSMWKWNGKGDKQPFLYLHTHPNDPLGWDIRAIMMQTNLIEDVDYKLLPKEYEEGMCPIDVLNKIYNASDVYLTTTLGEGWGLGFSEAAACKVPVIAPYSTSYIEMSKYGRNAVMLTTLYPYVHTNDNVIREQTDINEVGEKIIDVAECYQDADFKDMVERNYNWVKGLEWSEVCKSWIEHFKIY